MSLNLSKILHLLNISVTNKTKPIHVIFILRIKYFMEKKRAQVFY